MQPAEGRGLDNRVKPAIGLDGEGGPGLAHHLEMRVWPAWSSSTPIRLSVSNRPKTVQIRGLRALQAPGRLLNRVMSSEELSNNDPGLIGLLSTGPPEAGGLIHRSGSTPPTTRGEGGWALTAKALIEHSTAPATDCDPPGAGPCKSPNCNNHPLCFAPECRSCVVTSIHPAPGAGLSPAPSIVFFPLRALPICAGLHRAVRPAPRGCRPARRSGPACAAVRRIVRRAPPPPPRSLRRLRYSAGSPVRPGPGPG